MEPDPHDVESYEAYWDGFGEGARQGAKDAMLVLTQCLSAIKRLNSVRDVQIYCDIKLNQIKAQNSHTKS
jgi:hypothetical protein